MIRLKKLLESDYAGEHQSPDKDGGTPAFDLRLNDIYPNDIYTHPEYYIFDSEFDRDSYHIVSRLRGNPNAVLKVYRAVPNFNKDISKQIKKLSQLIQYYSSFGFFPVNIKYVSDAREEFSDSDHTYNEIDQLVLRKIKKEIGQLEKQKAKPIKINIGDWVTVNRGYAVDHGRSSLNGNYTIVQKSVFARDIFTDGNSLSEWGYDPQPKVKANG